MDLDFSGLESISKGKEQETEKTLHQLEESQTHAGIESAKEAGKALLAIYRQEQEAIRKAGQLRNDLCRDLKDSATNPLHIILKAVECISCITGETHVMNKIALDYAEANGYIPPEKKPPASRQMTLELIKKACPDIGKLLKEAENMRDDIRYKDENYAEFKGKLESIYIYKDSWKAIETAEGRQIVERELARVMDY